MILTGSAAGLDAGTATLTITDDDPAPTAVTLSLNPAAVGVSAAATAVTVTASLNNSPLPTATTVTVSRTGGTATSGTDYPAVSAFTVTIPAGQTSGTAELSFDPTGDGLYEGDETVIHGQRDRPDLGHGDADHHRRRRSRSQHLRIVLDHSGGQHRHLHGGTGLTASGQRHRDHRGGSSRPVPGQHHPHLHQDNMGIRPNGNGHRGGRRDRRRRRNRVNETARMPPSLVFERPPETGVLLKGMRRPDLRRTHRVTPKACP